MSQCSAIAGQAPRILVAAEPAGCGIEDEVVLARLPGRDDVEPENLGPGYEPDQEARLIAVDRGDDRAVRRSLPGEAGPDDAVELLRHEGEVLAGLEGDAGVARGRGRAPRRLDDHLEGQIGHHGEFSRRR